MRYFIRKNVTARDLWIVISAQQLSQQILGKYLIFFQITHAVNLLLHKIKLCFFFHQFNQTHSIMVILAIAVSKRWTQDFEHWIFVYLPFGHSRTVFSKTIFSLHLLTLGYNFRLTRSSLPRDFQASEKLWNSMSPSVSVVRNGGGHLGLVKAYAWSATTNIDKFTRYS